VLGAVHLVVTRSSCPVLVETGIEVDVAAVGTGPVATAGDGASRGATKGRVSSANAGWEPSPSPLTRPVQVTAPFSCGATIPAGEEEELGWVEPPYVAVARIVPSESLARRG
jgi:hypothetical protein